MYSLTFFRISDLYYSITIALFHRFLSHTEINNKAVRTRVLRKTLHEYYSKSNNIETNGINKRNRVTKTMITYGIYVNDNGLITYNEILMFIIDLLNHQAMLINMMAPVIVNVLQSALHGEVIP